MHSYPCDKCGDEATAPNGQRFGRHALANLLMTLGGEPIGEIDRSLISALDQHGADAAVGDDQTILMLNPCPRPAQPKENGDG